MKKRSLESALVPIIIALLLLFAAFMLWFLTVWGSWGHKSTEIESSLEKTRLEQALIVYNEDRDEYEIHIWDEAYEAEPYVETVNSDVRDTFPALSFSPRIAYRETERGDLYYTEIEGYPGWIAGFYDDELCVATTQNIEALYKAVDETEIPAWIEEARAVAVNGRSPGSHSGLEAGYTIKE